MNHIPCDMQIKHPLNQTRPHLLKIQIKNCHKNQKSDIYESETAETLKIEILYRMYSYGRPEDGS